MEKYVIKAVRKEDYNFNHNCGKVAVRSGERDTFYTMLLKAQEMNRSGLYFDVHLYKVREVYDDIPLCQTPEPTSRQLHLC